MCVYIYIVTRSSTHTNNARKMRGIYFIDPDDEEHKEILKNGRRKLQRPVAPTMREAEQCIRGEFQNDVELNSGIP